VIDSASIITGVPEQYIWVFQSLVYRQRSGWDRLRSGQAAGQTRHGRI